VRKAFHYQPEIIEGVIIMTEINRRRVLEILTVGGLTVTILLPSKWLKPVVESVIVPAHAQASPVRTPVRGSTSTTFTTFAPPY
jgi:hypothetical protein